MELSGQRSKTKGCIIPTIQALSRIMSFLLCRPNLGISSADVLLSEMSALRSLPTPLKKYRTSGHSLTPQCNLSKHQRYHRFVILTQLTYKGVIGEQIVWMRKVLIRVKNRSSVLEAFYIYNKLYVKKNLIDTLCISH